MVVIWTTPGGSSPERRLTAGILKPLLSIVRSPKRSEAGSRHTAPNRRLGSGGPSQLHQGRNLCRKCGYRFDLAPSGAAWRMCRSYGACDSGQLAIYKDVAPNGAAENCLPMLMFESFSRRLPVSGRLRHVLMRANLARTH